MHPRRRRYFSFSGLETVANPEKMNGSEPGSILILQFGKLFVKIPTKILPQS